MNQRGGGNSVQNCFLVAAAYGIVLLCTSSPIVGDTNNYAKSVADHLGKSPFAPYNTLWEFGHLLWRPLGWLVLTFISPILSRLTDWTDFVQAAFTLISISWVTSIATVVLWYLLLEDYMTSRTAAFLIAVVLACADAFILYAHSGSSYIPGLAALTASLYCIRKGRLFLAAIFYGLAALLWLPYILGGPALFLLAAIPSDWSVPILDSWPQLRIARPIRFAAMSAAFIIAVYCLGAAAHGVKSVSEAKDWYADANHGWSQSQRALRLATGLPRSTFYLGKDGILFKRFLRHDPYAPTGIAALLKASLWKMAVFYLLVALLLFHLWRSSPSGWPLLIFVAGACPIVFFAVFIFEPSSPERFLPAFPFVLIALGWVFRDVSAKPSFAQASMAAILIVMTVSNIFAFATPFASREDSAAWSRIAQLRSRIPSNSAIVVTTNQDKMEQYLGHAIFGPVSRPPLFLVYDVMEPGTVRMLQWRGEFAAYVFTTWNKGGEIWVSRRFWSEKPMPDWNWVEGDDPLQIWRDLHTFFLPIQTDADCDGADGFSRLAHNESNLNYLAPFAAGYKAPSYVPVQAGAEVR